jgi:hypothetical protein
MEEKRTNSLEEDIWKSNQTRRSWQKLFFVGFLLVYSALCVWCVREKKKRVAHPQESEWSGLGKQYRRPSRPKQTAPPRRGHTTWPSSFFSKKMYFIFQINSFSFFHLMDLRKALFSIDHWPKTFITHDSKSVFVRSPRMDSKREM